MEKTGAFSLPFDNPVVVFTLVLFVILVVPIVLKRVRVPDIIGLILSGVLIGPHGLNLITKSSAIELLSTIGLLYIMFLAGLELNLQEFVKQRNRSLTFGFFTFSLPILIGLPVCYYVLHFGFLTSLLTSVMFATHTLIAYPIVSRMGLAGNEAVAITVGGTIFTDTAVLIILSVISTSLSSNHDQWFALRTALSIALFLLFIFVVIPRLARWFFKAHQGDHGAHFVFVLFVVFLLGLMAQLAHVEPIIGAFAAGLVLNPFIPHNSTLMNRITFTGNALFIPFFLISVGMLVDPRILFSGYRAVEIALVLTVVAFTGKWAAAWLTQKFFGYSGIQRNLIFGLSSAHAAATLAIILVGYQLGVLDVNILNGTIILILITCLVATIVTERSAMKIAVSEDSLDLQTETQLERIIVPVAKPDNLEKLIELSIHLKDKASLTPVTVLSVVKDDENAAAKILSNHKQLSSIVDYAASMNIALDLTTALDINPASGILRLSRETMANMLVLGWRGKTTLSQQIFGHFYERIIQNFNGQIVIARLCNPINLHKVVKVLIPPFFTKEAGYSIALKKLIELTRNIKIKTELFGVSDDLDEIKHEVKHQKGAWNVSFSVVLSPEHFMMEHFHPVPDTLLFVFTGRDHTPSCHTYIKQLPRHLEEVGFSGSFILFYPAQNPMLSLKEIK